MSKFEEYLEKVQNNYNEGIIDSFKNFISKSKNFLRFPDFKETEIDTKFFDKSAYFGLSYLTEDKQTYKNMCLEILKFLKSKKINSPVWISMLSTNDLNKKVITQDNWTKKYCFLRIGNPDKINYLGFYKQFGQSLKSIMSKYKFRHLKFTGFNVQQFADFNFELIQPKQKPRDENSNKFATMDKIKK